MTKQARIKPCKTCKGDVVEKPNESNKQWEGREFCSPKCKGVSFQKPAGNIVQMYADHFNMTYIAIQYRISRTAVRSCLLRNGIKLRDNKGSRIPKEIRPAMIELYQETRSAHKVSEKYDYCRKTIETMLKEEKAMMPRNAQIAISTIKKNPELSFLTGRKAT